MRNSGGRGYILDLLGLGSIGIVSLGYIFYVRPFAELHFRIPFSELPVFIGEVLLFLSLLLLFLKGIEPKGKVFWIVVIYSGFVILRALWGYTEFGLLAFRHAALFYYPLFAVLGYSFYRRDFFKGGKISFFCFLLISFLFTRQDFNNEWLFTLFVLALILNYSYPQKIVKYIMLITLLLLTPYQFLFNTSRMMMVANTMAIVYLVISFYLILRIKQPVKLAMIPLTICFLAGGFILFADRNALKTIVKIDKIIEVYREYDMQVQAQIAENKRLAAREAEDLNKVHVYNPDPPMFFRLRGEDKLDASIPAGAIGQDKLPQETAILVDAPILAEANAPVQSRESTAPAIGQDKLAQEMVILVDTLNPIEKTRPSLAEVVQSKESTAPATGQDKLAQETVILVDTLNPIEKSRPSLAETSVPSAPSPVEANTLPSAKEPDGEIKVQIYNPDPSFSFSGKPQSNDVENLPKKAEQINTPQIKDPSLELRNIDVAYVNAVFRLFIWRDMSMEMFHKKAWFGFHFGKPLCPKSIKILNWAMVEFNRMGWIEPHNSFLHIIYRTGVIGLGLILAVLVVLYKMIRKSIQYKSVTGILLCGIIVNWFVAANFLLILELPYTAIPLWTLFGLTFAYLQGFTRPVPVDINQNGKN